jgi:murein DD-endopeptidase MepM/ murein hydrolase activator NlpD
VRRLTRLLRRLTVLAVAAGVLMSSSPAGGRAAEEVYDSWRRDPSVVSGGWPVAASRDVAGLHRSDGRPAWDWPLPGPPSVQKVFDPPAQRWLPGHRGVDLGGFTGSPVLAVDRGVVTYSGRIAGTGIVSVRHADGLLSTYQPVEDRIERGRTVASGDPLGTLATGGHCLVRSCLHLGARRGETYLDPLLLLRAWEVSLLPTARGRG